MFRSIVIGNLGADAKVQTVDGRQFVSFNVAHNDSYTKEDGTKVEAIQWISCALNGDGGKLLPFLKKGKLVYVEGRTKTRVFSSEKERKMVAGVNLSVDHIELLGGLADDVPSRLFDLQGVMHYVHKSYWIDNEEAAQVLGGLNTSTLITPSGAKYVLHAPCWVTPVPTDENNSGKDGQEMQHAPQENVEVFGSETDAATAELQQKMSGAREKRKK